MYNPLTHMVAEAQREELLAKAQQKRQHETSRPAQQRLGTRLGLRLAELLIEAGQHLQQRFEPAAYADLEGLEI